MDSKGSQLEKYDNIIQEKLGQFLLMWQKMSQRHVDEIRNPSLLLKTKYLFSGPDDFDRFPHSPTAQKYKQAFNCFLQGFVCLHNYTKDAVENETDCDFLKPGFQGYAVGYILENVMAGQFLPPDNTMKLLDEYLQFRPTDFLAEYFKLRLYLTDQSTQEKLMKNIIACEILANKIESREITDTERMVLTDTYNVVAALYTVSEQTRRAVDSFEKSFRLDVTNSIAIYGIAFNIIFAKPDRAESLLLKFLEETPNCDKKYPNCLYQLCMFYTTLKHNVSKGARYFELAVESERNRLPFLPEVNLDAKTSMMEVMPLIQSKGYCNNPECQTETQDAELKKCTRCRNVSYCGRDCQRQDWSYHKKSCKDKTNQ